MFNCILVVDGRGDWVIWGRGGKLEVHTYMDWRSLKGGKQDFLKEEQVFAPVPPPKHTSKLKRIVCVQWWGEILTPSRIAQ